MYILRYTVLYQNYILLYTVLYQNYILLYTALHQNYILLYTVLYQNYILRYTVLYQNIVQRGGSDRKLVRLCLWKARHSVQRETFCIIQKYWHCHFMFLYMCVCVWRGGSPFIVAFVTAAAVVVVFIDCLLACLVSLF